MTSGQNTSQADDPFLVSLSTRCRETVRTWLNARPDLLLAIAKRHTTNPLLNPLPSTGGGPSSSSSPSPTPTLKLDVPRGGLTAEKVRIRVSTRARNVEVDIPLPAGGTGSPYTGGRSGGGGGLGKGGFGRKIEGIGKEALRYFGVPRHPKITYFNPPLLATFAPLPPLLLLLFLIFVPPTNTYAEIGRGLVHRYLGKWVIPSAGIFAAVCHLVIEPLILAPRLRKHAVPMMPTLLYMGTVLLIGYGGIDALNRAGEVVDTTSGATRHWYQYH
ncbi:hypothetical protein I316_02097 [Kwoniella heveanensis BCC8398]|uniref:Uncharacterized protein n=1 Tax=Kwoniella heveanensis BCC8398 TaxID=1296120 RepID=A0A1B9GZ07_9TREE|nr:hypothetical protein I316_02097 [Kwoniella heveanensis BCC8398]